MKRALIAVGVLWLALLGGFIGLREFTLRTGQAVLLKTVPVDPRDLFRGDYVTLRYEISTLDLETVATDRSTFAEGETVYVSLKPDGRFHVPSAVSSQRPDRPPVVVKGRVTHAQGRRLTVAYGIESYFVPEGQGRALERSRGKTLEVQASIDRFGTAAIKALLMDGAPVNLR